MSVQRVYLDLTHVGRHVTGLERIAIEQFEKVDFAGCEIVPVRAKGAVSMVLRQQLLLPLLALLHPSAHFVFPGFPPSPVFGFMGKRVTMYVHDIFLLTRTKDLSAKARLYMAPQFAFALKRLKRFLVNSEKTLGEVRGVCREDATITLYRPAVANVFALDEGERAQKTTEPRTLRLAALGTIEPRKNYAAAVAILDELGPLGAGGAELHIIGRAGWGEDAGRIASNDGVTVHGYLPAQDVKTLLEQADVYLCTSHDEGLGLPLLEAQYAGLPIVAPDAPVFREVLGTSGTFIDTSDPKAAAAIIAALVQEHGWRAKQSRAALDNVARWNSAAAQDLATAKRLFAARSEHTAQAPRMAAGTP